MLKTTHLLLFVSSSIILTGCCHCHSDTLWFNRPSARDVYYQDYYQSPPIPQSTPHLQIDDVRYQCV